MSTRSEKLELLSTLEATFEEQGGRGVDLAEAIDSLRAELEEPAPKYYRTVVEVEVLSSEPIEFYDLGDLHELVTEGHASGSFTVTSEEEVDEEKMAELLTAQGSDPSFLIYED